MEDRNFRFFYAAAKKLVAQKISLCVRPIKIKILPIFCVCQILGFSPILVKILVRGMSQKIRDLILLQAIIQDEKNIIILAQSCTRLQKVIYRLSQSLDLF